MKSTKRGFATKREAEEWLRVFLTTKQDDCTMNFEEFVQLYYKGMESRLREHTMHNKKHLIEQKKRPVMYRLLGVSYCFLCLIRK